MAHERGMVDTEAGISMRAWGWMAYKHGDATRCPKCGTVVIPGGPPGVFDFPEIGVWNNGKLVFIDVEVKAGDTSVAFADLRQDQRKWAEEHQEREKFLWICIGKCRPNSVVNPRKTYFFPLDLFYELEKNMERKSIPYNCTSLIPYELRWEGSRTWSIPDTHPCKQYFNITQEEPWR